MKKKSSRLRPIEKLAEDKANVATADMVSARNTHQTHEQKLKDLVSYRFEYIEQFQNRAKKGMQASQLQQYQKFISQLDIAIQQQKMTVEQAGYALDKSQDQWRNKNSHKKAINKAVNRYKQKESQAEEKIEEAEMDDDNTQRHNRNSLIKS